MARREVIRTNVVLVLALAVTIVGVIFFSIPDDERQRSPIIQQPIIDATRTYDSPEEAERECGGPEQWVAVSTVSGTRDYYRCIR